FTEPAPASRLETRPSAIGVRPAKAVLARPATPPTGPTIKEMAREERGRAGPEPPSSATDDARNVPVTRGPQAERSDAGERADPDPTAVIRWLLEKYPAGRALSQIAP